MRYYQIVESKQVMDLLGDVADMIIYFLPAVVRDDEIVSINLRDYDSEREVRSLLDKYGSDDRFREGLHRLTDLRVTIDNKHPSNAKGVYTHQSNFKTADLIINCKFGANESDWGKPLFTSAARAAKGINITLRSTLIHELRHHFQRFSYPDYYKKSGKHEDYHTNPVEIDAAWFHHLDEFKVADYSSAKEYADAVMRNFLAYKKVDTDRARHYYRKTVKFWIDQNSDGSARPDLASRLEASRARRAQEMADLLPSADDDIDLRKVIAGYDGGNFIFGAGMLRQARAMIIAKKIASPVNAFIILMLYAIEGRIDPAVAREFVETVSGLSFADIVAQAEIPASFDVESMKEYVRSKY